jgi:tetratricopeptide (TPR) repeat protein
MHRLKRGKFPEAESILSEAIERQRLVLPEKDPLLLEAMAMLARVHAGQKNFEQAEALDRRVLELRRGVLGPNHAMTVNVEIHLAEIYLRRGEFPEAEKFHERLLNLLLGEGRLVENRLAVRSLVGLMSLYTSQQRWEKGDELANAVVSAGQKQFGDPEGSLKIVAMDDELARSLMAQGRYAQAEPHLRRAVEIREKYHMTNGRRYSAMSMLGECLFRQNKESEQAESLLKTGLAELEQRFNQLPEHLRFDSLGRALQRLIDFYEASGKPARAYEWKHRLTELENAAGRRLPAAGSPPVF